MWSKKHAVQATDKLMQQRVAVALAWLGKEADLRQSFVDRRGLDVLLELLTDQRRDASSHREAAGKSQMRGIALSACLANLKISSNDYFMVLEPSLRQLAIAEPVFMCAKHVEMLVPIFT